MGTEGWFHHSFCPPIYFQCKITMQNVHVTYLCDMKPDQLLRAILPEVLIDNFDIEGFEKRA